MSDMEWEREYRIQTEGLRIQLAALRTAGNARWNERRLLQLVCRQCGDRIVEVMNLYPYRVVCTRDSSVVKGERPPRPGPGATSDEIREWARLSSRQTTTLQRKGDGMFHAIPDPWEPADNEMTTTACRCRSWTLASPTIADSLSRGERKVVVAPVG